MAESNNTDLETAVWSQEDEFEPEQATDEPKVDMSEKIVEYLQLYWKKRFLALAIIVVVTALSVGYALLFMRNYYTSTTTLMPPDNSSPYSSMLGMLSGGGASTALGSEALGLSTPGELLVAILESRTVLDSMVARFDLIHYYKVRVTDDARKVLTSNTKIDQDRKSGVITIVVTADDANTAYKLADGYVFELNRVMTENSTSAARRERIFLEGRVKEVKEDLDESSAELSQFSAKSKSIDVSEEAKSMVAGTLRLQEQIADGESQLAALRQTYSDDNYRVKALAARVGELRRELAGVGASERGAEGAAAAGGTVLPNIGRLSTLALTYADLERRVKTDEALWEGLIKQYETARVEEAKEIPSVHVLDPANLPIRKAGPKRSVFVFSCAFFAFLLSCMVIFAPVVWEGVEESAFPKKLVANLTGKGPRTQPSA